MAKGGETPQGKSAVSWAGHPGPPGCLSGQRRPVAAKIGLMLASGCSVECVRCVQCVDMHGVDMFFGLAVWAIIYCVLQVGKKVAHALLCNIRDTCALCKARLTLGLDLNETLARVRSHCQENERSGHFNGMDRKYISEESLVPVQDICKGYTVSVTLLANRSDNLSWRS